MTTPTRTIDHLVIGGGPAGAMAAIRLAEAGRRVLLVEKEIGPHHKVCGEFLSQEAIEYLHSVSVFPADLGAVPIGCVRLSSGSRVAESTLPFAAFSLSRRALDAAMLARASAAGCEVQRGLVVESLFPREGAWLAQFAGGQCIEAPTAFLACGKHDLRGWNRPQGAQGDLVGFKLHWRLNSAQIALVRESLELFLFSGGYGGLSLIENQIANLCLVVRRSRLRNLGGWTALIAALLAENHHMRGRLAGAEPLYPRPLAISPIPYGHLDTRSDGFWRIGDQAAVIPSFTGDGISIALHSASLAAEMYLKGKSSNEYVSALRQQLLHPMCLATALSRAMVTALGRHAAHNMLSLTPGIVRSIAAATRIPPAALLHVRGLLPPCRSALEPAPFGSRHSGSM